MEFTTSNALVVSSWIDQVSDTYELPGHMLARWAKDEGLQRYHPNRDVLDLFRNANRDGYGNRSVAQSMGVCSYFGQRGTNMSSPSVVEGPGNASKSQYFRISNQHHPEYMVVANKALNRVSNAAYQVRRALDPMMSMIHQVDTRPAQPDKFSRMKSTTFGKKDVISAFACSMHTDRTDLFADEVADSISLDVYMAYNKKGRSYHKEPRYEYIDSFSERYGSGKPTTVMYHEIKGISGITNHDNSNEIEGEIQQFFLHEGLFTACPIAHGNSLLFHSFTHRHGSSVAYQAWPDGKVRVKNVNDHHIFAFSNSC